VKEKEENYNFLKVHATLVQQDISATFGNSNQLLTELLIDIFLNKNHEATFLRVHNKISNKY